MPALVRSAILAGALLSVSTLPLAFAAAGSLDAPGQHEGVDWSAPLEVAQGYGRPQVEIGGDAYAAPPSDAAALLLRIDRLESQIRQLTGQVEQMQFTTRKLEEQLRKFQQDVEFRFQEGAGQGGSPAAPPAKAIQRRSDADELIDIIGAEPAGGADEPSEIMAPRRPTRRSDAFDPQADPTAPGAPRPLGSRGSMQPSGPIGRLARETASPPPGLAGDDPDAPLDLSGGKLRARGTPEIPSDGAPHPLSPAQPRLSGSSVAASEPASPPPADPAKEDFDRALGLLKQKEYESAEKGFAAFVQKYPKSRLASDAIYYLGESYFQRGRQREAAEQYLKISTRYASAPRAPEAFLRLGQSLNALGAKEQACAAYAEIARKYPNASAAVRSGAERESKRAQC